MPESAILDMEYSQEGKVGDTIRLVHVHGSSE